MALNFHRLDNSEYLFGLDNTEYAFLSPIFEIYYQRTGNYVDPYKSMQLTTENCHTLLQIIDKYVQQTDLNKDKQKTSAILEFKGLMKYFTGKDINFILHGD